MQAQIRPATLADYAHFVRLFPELGTGDTSASADRFESEIVDNMLVAEEDATVVAYTFYQELHDTGYVRHLVVAPEARRKGYGRRLLLAMRERLLAKGRTKWCLNVEPDNSAAVGLYESMGMSFAYNSCATKLSWGLARRAARRELMVEKFGPGEDAALEAAFSLPGGQVSDHRSKKERVFVKVMDGASLRGFTVFDRMFPGTYPFRVRDIDAGWKLLEAVHLHARSGDDHIRSIVEDDFWRDELLDAGAEILLRVAHYRGAL